MTIDIRPIEDGTAVTANDSTNLGCTRAVWVGGAGDLAVTFYRTGNVRTIVGVPAGTMLPIRVSKVMSTNTTATSILALY
jgi:hypothetical protein